MIEEMNEKLMFFYKNKIYTYIRLTTKTFFNGYIESIDKTSIIFKDDRLGDKPILKSDIEILDYSKNVEAKP